MHLLAKMWAEQQARGDKPSPVWLVLSTGKDQPLGYLLGWSIKRRGAQQIAEKFNGTRLAKLLPSL